MGGPLFLVKGQVLGPGPFLTAPGQPLPTEGAGLEQVLAVGRLLYLGQAQSVQEGTYTCECVNAAGNSSQEQQLEVLGEPCQGWGQWVSGWI